MSQHELDEVVKARNRKKLLQQNTKIHAELKRLQSQIEALEEHSEPKKVQENQPSPLKAELESQMRQIKKLKDQIEAKRHENVKQNVIYIRKEQNELVALKKELQNLMREKELVISLHQDKLDKLATNEPLQKHKDGITHQWAQTKKQNRQLNLKMVEIERQIRKFHTIKEKSKTISSSHPSQSSEITMELEIQKMNTEMRAKEIKWKPNMEALDTQFFSNKNQLLNLQRRIEEMEKQAKQWKVRANALRDQPQLEHDHTRISKLTTMQKSQNDKNLEESHRYYVNSAFSTKKKVILINRTAQLPRAESTPNPPPTKKLLDLMNINDDIQAKKKRVKKSLPPRQTPQKSKIESQKGMMGSFQKIQAKKKQKSVQESSALFNETPEIKQVVVETSEKKVKNKNFSSVREKHRVKSHAASNLAEELKKRADQVKQINDDLKMQGKLEQKNQKQKAKEKQISFANKPKVNSIHVESSPKSNTQKAKELSLLKLQKQKSKKSIEIVTKLEPPAEVPTAKNQNKKNKQEKVERSTGKNIEKYKQEKEYIESINIQVRENKVKPTPKFAVQLEKTDEKIVKVDTIPSPPKVVEPQSPKKHIKTSDAPPSPKNVKKMEKPRFDIMIMDNPKPKSPKKDILRVEITKNNEIEEDTDGIPRIIRRKKPAQPKLVSSSTST